MNKEKLELNWKLYEKHPTWSCVTSRELSKILGVSLQTINNWKMREVLPPPVEDTKHKGNFNYYRISSIRAWLESISEEEIHWHWVDKNLNNQLDPPIASLEQAMQLVNVAHKELGIHKPV